MAALEFPDSPAAGDIYDAPNGVQYQYDGMAWNVVSAAAGVPGPQGEIGPQGPAGADGAQGPQGVPGLGLRFVMRVPTVADLPATAVQGDIYIVEETGDGHVWDETIPGFVNSGPIVGPTGSQGPAGPQGETGPAGADGADGKDGLPGKQGDVGPQGEQGIQGETGPAGADGAQGPQGPQGEVGPKGDQGFPGEVGAEGPVGPAGADGAQGIQGEVGPKGDQGAPGEIGPEGPVGPAGAQGETGPAGPQGEVGPKGDQGDQGIPGLGITFKGRVATVGDLPATAAQGDLYLVTETGDAWVWSDTAAAFENAGPIVGPTGPQGEAGPTGATGPEGQQGPAGPTAVSADADNTSVIGTDGLLFTPAPDLTGYVPRTGADMTGQLNFKGDGAVAFQFDNGFNFQGLAQSSALRYGTVSVLGFTENDVVAAVPFRLIKEPTLDTHAVSKKYVDDKVATGGTLPIASATRLGGVKIGTGMSVTADGTISTTASTNYVNKSGDVMNGPLRYANSGSVSSFNGQDVYTYYDGTYFRVQLPGGKSGYTIEIATGKVTFSTTPKCVYAPVEVSDLTNKSYVDSAVSSSTAFLKTTGGTMTGGITLPTTVQSLTWGTSTYNIFGANGGVAVRYGNANIVNFTATGASFTQKITTPGAGIGVEFGSSGGYLSKVGTGIGAYTGGALRFTIDTSAVSSTVPIAISVPATAANHAVTKSYVDALPTIVSMPAGGTAPDAASYPNNTLLVEYTA